MQRFAAHEHAQPLGPAVVQRRVGEFGDVRALTHAAVGAQRRRPSVGLVEEGATVQGYPSDAYWADLGTPERCLAGTRDVLAVACDWPPAPDLVTKGEGALVHVEATVEGAHLVGPVVVGAGCRVAPGAELRHAVLFDGVRVEGGATVHGAIVGGAPASAAPPASAPARSSPTARSCPPVQWCLHAAEPAGPARVWPSGALGMAYHRDAPPTSDASCPRR